MSHQVKRTLKTACKYLLLSLGGFVMIFPFAWMILTSLKTLPEAEMIPPSFFPSEFVWSNYTDAMKAAPFGRYFFNTIIVAVVGALLTVILTVLAAYAFAVYEFRGKKFLFAAFLTTMMVPTELLIIQNYVTVTHFGWLDTYQGIILPLLVSGFYIFMAREYFSQMPAVLFKAAYVDGCNGWRYLWKVMVPMNKNAIATIGILSFISYWNTFMWPLMVTNSDSYRTLSIGLLFYNYAVSNQTNMQMAGTTIVLLPMVIFYLIFHKKIIEGVSRSGIKG